MSIYVIIRVTTLIICTWFLIAHIVGAVRYSLPILLYRSIGYLLIDIVMVLEIFYYTSAITSALLLVSLIWIVVFGRILNKKMEYSKTSWRHLLLFRKQ
jgi:hypothetical protein